MRYLVLLLLFAVDAAFASSTTYNLDSDLSSYTPDSDISLNYLRMLFAPAIDNASLLSDSNVPGMFIAKIFNVFNAGILIIIFGFAGFTVFNAALLSATDSSMMKRKIKPMTTFRNIAGAMLVAPTTSGYASIQLALIKIVILGVGLANGTWQAALHHLERMGGNSMVSAPAMMEPDVNQIATRFLGIYNASRCLESHRYRTTNNEKSRYGIWYKQPQNVGGTGKVVFGRMLVTADGPVYTSECGEIQDSRPELLQAILLSSRYIYNKVAEQYQFGYSINKNEQTRNRPGLYNSICDVDSQAPAEACEPAASVTQAALYFYTATLPLRIKDQAPNEFSRIKQQSTADGWISAGRYFHVLANNGNSKLVINDNNSGIQYRTIDTVLPGIPQPQPGNSNLNGYIVPSTSLNVSLIIKKIISANKPMLDGSSGNEYEDQMRAKAVTNMVKGLVKDDTIVEAAMQKQTSIDWGIFSVFVAPINGVFDLLFVSIRNLNRLIAQSIEAFTGVRMMHSSAYPRSKDYERKTITHKTMLDAAVKFKDSFTPDEEARKSSGNFWDDATRQVSNVAEKQAENAKNLARDIGESFVPDWSTQRINRTCLSFLNNKDECGAGKELSCAQQILARQGKASACLVDSRENMGLIKQVSREYIIQTTPSGKEPPKPLNPFISMVVTGKLLVNVAADYWTHNTYDSTDAVVKIMWTFFTVKLAFTAGAFAAMTFVTSPPYFSWGVAAGIGYMYKVSRPMLDMLKQAWISIVTIPNSIANSFAMIVYSIGNFMGFFIPFIPVVTFTMAAIGWLMLVIEAMIAAPLVALGLTNPQGHDYLGMAQQSVLMFTATMLRPAIIIIAYFIAINLLFVGFKYLNYMVINIMPVWVTLNDDNVAVNALFIVGVMLVYSYFSFAMMMHILEVINDLPDKILRWIGGTMLMPGGSVRQLLSEAKGGYGGAMDAAARGAGQSMTKTVSGAARIASTWKIQGDPVEDLYAKRRAEFKKDKAEKEEKEKEKKQEKGSKDQDKDQKNDRDKDDRNNRETEIREARTQDRDQEQDRLRREQNENMERERDEENRRREQEQAGQLDGSNIDYSELGAQAQAEEANNLLAQQQAQEVRQTPIIDQNQNEKTEDKNKDN